MGGDCTTSLGNALHLLDHCHGAEVLNQVGTSHFKIITTKFSREVENTTIQVFFFKKKKGVRGVGGVARRGELFQQPIAKNSGL